MKLNEKVIGGRQGIGEAVVRDYAVEISIASLRGDERLAGDCRFECRRMVAAARVCFSLARRSVS
jgi:hypothetical protein